jgi:FKBP-type peptidyl-prolyl cis-trans isomerase (trigger factor)
MAINDSVVEILLESKVSFLGRPDVAISKIAIDSPIEFKIKVAVMPEVKLPDYKKIAKNENKVEEKVEEVSEKQVEETIEQIRKIYANQNHPESDKNASDGANTHVHSADCKHEDINLPEVNDEFVRNLEILKILLILKLNLKKILQRKKKFMLKKKREVKF